MSPFAFSSRKEFLNRRADLERLEDWWAGRDPNALVLYGRRRVGKSWLFRAFADGKPAVVLVAERRAEGAQLKRFADQLQPYLGVRPDLSDLPALISALYKLADQEKTLAIIDELPYLLPTRSERRYEVLTAVQAVMEERGASKLKLVLCGSYIGQMTSLLSETSPLRGRLTPLAVEPLRFAEAQAFIEDSDPRRRIESYAVAGGTSLYLDELARGHGDLRARVCERVLNPRGPLFNDPREILEEELRQPGIYFSLLEELASGARAIGDLATALGKRTRDLGPYLEALEEMRLLEKIAPVTASRAHRDHRFRLADGFMRFWFRFVFNFQEDLRTGLRPRDHYNGEIAPALAEHVAPVFEALCREWVRGEFGGMVSRVGSWWGSSLNELRRSGQRQTEEIDVVGLRRGAVAVVGECKWTAKQMTARTLEDLRQFKLPAMRQAKIGFAREGPLILLFSRSGFAKGLVEIAAEREDIRLVGLDELVEGLGR
jgi:AAA+ ATPase superfamily predicted ATPase